MHNWRLLILAFLAVLHPIASFTERNLVDGREQCCDRQHTLLRDTRLSYGTYRLNKPSEDRHLSQREEIREDRRYEVRQDDSVLTRPVADRRLVEYRSEKGVNRISPELGARFVRAEHRRFRVFNPQREGLSTSGIRDNRIRDTRRFSFRDLIRDKRIREISGERLSRHADILSKHDHDSRKTSRMPRDNNRIVRSVNDERQFRIMMDSRRETQQNQDGSGELRIRVQDKETRNIPQRGRHDVNRFDTHRERQNRRVVRERMDQRRAFTLRSESRLLDNIQERRSQNRRIRESFDESRRAISLESRSDNRNRNFAQESRFAHLNSKQAVERVDERRKNSDGNRLSRDRSMAIRRESRETSEERRLYREFDRGSRKDERQSRAFSREEKTTSESRLVESSVFREPARIRQERATSESRRVESRMTRRESARNREERATSESRYLISRTTREPALNREERQTSEPRRVESRMTRREPARNREERATSESRIIISRLTRKPVLIREDRETSESRRVNSRITRVPARIREQTATSETSEVESRLRWREPARNREDRATSELRRVNSRITRESARNNEERQISDSRRVDSRITREKARFREERAISESRRIDSRLTREQARFRGERATSESHRVESRLHRDAGVRDQVMSRREHRSLDRLAISENSRDPILSRSTEESRERNVSPIRNEYRHARNAERKTESRFRSNEVLRSRSNFAFIIREKTQNEEQTVPMSWQHLFYTLQGIYLCSVLMQILGDNGFKKKSRVSRWWTNSQSLVKAD